MQDVSSEEGEMYQRYVSVLSFICYVVVSNDDGDLANGDYPATNVNGICLKSALLIVVKWNLPKHLGH